eukprot:TRINITY_DN5184_c0_g1_i1.p2 TRINITY_DN5184_c0_g1~~TRINITY_DN5184_c0_g1_i1.p2  ORF type:complete len:195 (+),score=53.02 TRINITY_DN5184_c0_g1_i1:85-585(+)
MVHLSSVAGRHSYHPGAPAIAAIISEVCSEADTGKATAVRPGNGAFRSVSVPSVTVAEYLARLIKHSDCSPSAFVLMFILVNRWAKRFDLTSLCVHRVMAAAFVVAVFSSDDEYDTFSRYGWICGLSSSEMHTIVLEFIKAIDFDTNVSARDHERVGRRLSRCRLP